MLQRAAVEDFLAKVSAARIAGDADALAALFDDDAEFRILGLGAPVKGKAAIRQALQELIEAYEFLEYKPLQLFIDGNDISARQTLSLRHRPSGATAETETADFLTMKDGKCVRFIQFADTALAMGIGKG